MNAINPFEKKYFPETKENTPQGVKPVKELTQADAAAERTQLERQRFADVGEFSRR